MDEAWWLTSLERRKAEDAAEESGMHGEDKVNDEDLTFHADEAGASSDFSTSEGSDDGMPQGPPRRKARTDASSAVAVYAESVTSPPAAHTAPSSPVAAHADSVTALPADMRRSSKANDGRVVVR